MKYWWTYFLELFAITARLISVEDVRFKPYHVYFNFWLLFKFSIICQTPDSNIFKMLKEV